MTPSNGQDRLYRLAAEGDPDAARRLAHRARRRGDALQAAAASAAATLSEADALQAVFDRFGALREPEAELRLLALRELIALPVAAPLRLPAVELSVEDPDSSVRALAFELLEALLRPDQESVDRDEVVALLSRGLRDPKPAVRDRAAAALFVADLGPLVMAEPDAELADGLRDRVLVPHDDWHRALRTQLDLAAEGIRRGDVTLTELAGLSPSVVWAWTRHPEARCQHRAAEALAAVDTLPRHFLRRLADDLDLWPEAVAELLLHHRDYAHRWPRALRRALEDRAARTTDDSTTHEALAQLAGQPRGT